MNKFSLRDALWGDKGRLGYLLFFAGILLFSFLGAREIWTQEHRWADIVSGMFYRQDFLHPYLGEQSYYDKPLLSYWLIVITCKLLGNFNTWALRLPSSLAGLLAIFSIYQLGKHLKNNQLGLLAGWLLITTFYFLFWARISSADMLNLAGSLSAVAWYYAKRKQAGFLNYLVFFMMMAVTSLCKGLVGAIVPVIAVFTDMCLERSFRYHLRSSLLLSFLVAALFYLAPFMASSFVGGGADGENGLYLVYRENILRFFHPFDHQGSIYTYFIYLPIYLLPWTFFFILALISLPSRLKQMSLSTKWLAITNLLIFTFFSMSGSRRSYYILPLVPFAILFVADWLLSELTKDMYRRWTNKGITLFFVLFFFVTDIMPAWYYSQYGVNAFADSVKQQANHEIPWEKQQIVLLDAESKLNFYLSLPPTIKHYELTGDREKQSALSLLKAWPILENKPSDAIFITRQRYLSFLQPFFTNYRIITLPPVNPLFSFLYDKENAPIAFVPPLKA